MSIKLNSQNKLTSKRINVSNIFASDYWINTINNCILYSTATDSLNNVYAVGYTSSFGSGNNDLLLIKFDSAGNLMWQKTLGGTVDEYGYNVTTDSSDNVYVCGETNSPGVDGLDSLLAKYDKDGTLIWQRRLTTGLGYRDALFDVVVDSSGNIYTCGWRNKNISYADMALVKYLPDGSTSWIYNPAANAVGDYEGYGIALDPGGNNLYVTGNYNGDILLIKYNISTPGITWQRYINAGTGPGQAVAVDSSDNVYIVGRNATDIIIIKYDNSGNLIWQRNLSSSGTDAGTGIKTDSSGNVYVFGTSSNQGAGSYDVVLAKYNPSGTLIWQRSFGSIVSEYYSNTFGKFDIDRSGNICFCIVSGNGSCIVRLPPDGSLTGSYGAYTLAPSNLTSTAQNYTNGVPSSQLANYSGGLSNYTTTLGSSTPSFTATRTRISNDTVKRYFITALGSSSTESGLGIARDSLGNIYVTGYTVNIAGDDDVLIAKFDKTGTIVWQRILSGAGENEAGQAIATDSSNNVYILGYSTITVDYILLVKYDTDGNLVWQKKLGDGVNSSIGYDIAIDTSDNIYITGYTGTDLIFVKYNTSGDVIWQKLLSGGGLEIGYSITTDTSGNIYINGYTNSQGNGGNEVIVVKYNSSGTYLWGRRLGDNTGQDGRSIAVDSSGNVYSLNNTGGAGSTGFNIAKWDTSGTLQWQTYYNGSSFSSGYKTYHISIDPSDNIMVVIYDSGNARTLAISITSAGAINYTRSIDGVICNGALLDSGSTLLIVGYTSLIGAGGTDLFLSCGILSGTYGSFTWSNVSNLSTAASAWGGASLTLSQSTGSLTASNATLTSTVSTLTQTRTLIN